MGVRSVLHSTAVTLERGFVASSGLGALLDGMRILDGQSPVQDPSPLLVAGCTQVASGVARLGLTGLQVLGTAYAYGSGEYETMLFMNALVEGAKTVLAVGGRVVVGACLTRSLRGTAHYVLKPAYGFARGVGRALTSVIDGVSAAVYGADAHR